MTAFEQQSEESAFSPIRHATSGQLNLLNIIERGTTAGGTTAPRDTPVQVASLGSDLTVLAAAATTAFCNPLFDVDRDAHHLADKLNHGATPSSPSVLHLLGVVLNGRTNDQTRMHQATMALNDVYLDRTGYRANLDDNGVFSLVNRRTGQATEYRFATTTVARPR